MAAAGNIPAQPQPKSSPGGRRTSAVTSGAGAPAAASGELAAEKLRKRRFDVQCLVAEE